ncbi:transcriptional regulator, IclR family [Delftia sp. Cs1-4]|uniref:IclR family transcriptional regulator n=1 Tax=Delftia sp. (strain Cs1-4) TaxID=742013 RepID=UPI00020E7984|nr:IclR family transcriptional regulator [Delftia sp. Cs1-4]AEF88684.1 transcriptional regulator, IclR family [Delftia sp. Cs1-4]
MPRTRSIPGSRRAAPVAAAKSSGTQTIERASQLVKLVASRSSTGMRLTEVVQQSGLQRPTAHRILKCLVDEGFLMQVPDSHQYFLGPLIFELGLASAPQFNLCDICRPSLQRIAEQTGDTVFLSVRSGYDWVCIDRVEGSFPIKALMVELGARAPLGVGATGMALLLPLSPEAVDEIVCANARRLGPHGLTVPSAMKLLQRSRQLGYALNKRGTAAAITLGLPIVNRYGHPFAGIAIAAIASRMTSDRQAQMVDVLRAEITEIEQTLAQVTQL